MPPERSDMIVLPSSQIRLHVLDWGGEADQVLVLLHGLASSCHMFDLVAGDLSAWGHVFAVDQRGHGLSDKPDTGYDFETIAADLDALLAVLNPDRRPLVLVGHSWGAYSTLYYAATRPGAVSKAVLLDGGIKRLADHYPTWEEARVGMAPPVYQNRSLEDIRTMIEVDWLGPIFRPELMPLALSIFDTGDPADVRAHLSRENHLQIAHALWAFNPADYYARIACPVLIVNAVPPGQSVSQDVESSTQLAQDTNARAEVRWMMDTVHDIPWHRPGQLVAILKDFLAE